MLMHRHIELNVWALIASPCVIDVNRRGKSKEKKSCWHVLAALLNVLQWAISLWALDMRQPATGSFQWAGSLPE